MSKTRKEIFREPIAAQPGKFIKAEVHYRKDARVRGYYFDAIAECESTTRSWDNTHDVTSVAWLMGEQSKSHLLQEAKRFSAKDLDRLQPSPELIEQVKAETLASLYRYDPRAPEAEPANPTFG